MSSNKNANSFIEAHIHRRFQVCARLGEGAYGVVWRVQERASSKIYALKKIFSAFQHSTDAQRTYREIEILKQLRHPNIIRLIEMIPAENNNDVYLVFEYIDMDLHRAINDSILQPVHLLFVIYQLARALKYLHSGCILHRDIKPSNILLDSQCQLKLCDFGLVRSLDTISHKKPVLTEGVATRWYRAPELLFGSKTYSTPVDVWSFGCIIYQMAVGKPLFSSSTNMEQIQKIISVTGYPTEEDLLSIDSDIAESILKEIKISTNIKPINYTKNIKPQIAELIRKIIVFNPKKRISIDEIIKYPCIAAVFQEQTSLICEKPITTKIDDNKKLTKDEYRALIYGASYTKPRILSASMGGVSSTSLKNMSKAANVNQSYTKQGQIPKKYMVSQHTKSQKINDSSEQITNAAKPARSVQESKSMNLLQKHVETITKSIPTNQTLNKQQSELQDKITSSTKEKNFKGYASMNQHPTSYSMHLKKMPTVCLTRNQQTGQYNVTNKFQPNNFVKKIQHNYQSNKQQQYPTLIKGKEQQNIANKSQSYNKVYKNEPNIVVNKRQPYKNTYKPESYNVLKKAEPYAVVEKAQQYNSFQHAKQIQFMKPENLPNSHFIQKKSTKPTFLQNCMIPTSFTTKKQQNIQTRLVKSPKMTFSHKVIKKQ